MHVERDTKTVLIYGQSKYKGRCVTWTKGQVVTTTTSGVNNKVNEWVEIILSYQSSSFIKNLTF